MCRARAANDIADCIGRKLKGSDFVGHHDISDYLKAGANQKVVYSTVVCVNRYGKTAQYVCNAFAVAFYDFQIHLIDDGEPLNTVTGDMSLNEAAASSVPGFSYSISPNAEDGLISVSENNSLESSTTTVTLEEGTSATVSTTSESTENYSVGENLGVSATMSGKIPLVAEGGMTVSGGINSTNRKDEQWCTSLNWDKILKEMPKAHTKNSAYKSKMTEHEEMVNRIINRYPMSLTGASTSCTETSINSSLAEPKPIYPIKYIYVNYQLNRDFILTVGESLPIYSYRVDAYDESMVPYYGFVKGWGEWKIVDANGNPASSAVAVMTTDPVTHQQTVEAKSAGTTYVKYFINEGVYTDYGGRVSKNKDITSPAYKITVQSAPEAKFSGTIQLTGEVEAVVNEPVNLNALEDVSATVYDTTGKQQDIQVKWEAQELEKNGIKVTENGVLTATKPGTYHVRAFFQDVYSGWIPVTAVEAQDGLDALVLSTQVQEEDSPTVPLPTEAKFNPKTMLSRGEFVQLYLSLCDHPGDAEGVSGFSDVGKPDRTGLAGARAPKSLPQLGNAIKLTKNIQ